MGCGNSHHIDEQVKQNLSNSAQNIKRKQSIIQNDINIITDPWDQSNNIIEQDIISRTNLLKKNYLIQNQYTNINQQIQIYQSEEKSKGSKEKRSDNHSVSAKSSSVCSNRQRKDSYQNPHLRVNTQRQSQQTANFKRSSSEQNFLDLKSHEMELKIQESRKGSMISFGGKEDIDRLNDLPISQNLKQEPSQDNIPKNYSNFRISNSKLFIPNQNEARRKSSFLDPTKSWKSLISAIREQIDQDHKNKAKEKQQEIEIQNQQQKQQQTQIQLQQQIHQQNQVNTPKTPDTLSQLRVQQQQIHPRQNYSQPIPDKLGQQQLQQPTQEKPVSQYQQEVYDARRNSFFNDSCIFFPDDRRSSNFTSRRNSQLSTLALGTWADRRSSNVSNFGLSIMSFGNDISRRMSNLSAISPKNDFRRPSQDIFRRQSNLLGFFNNPGQQENLNLQQNQLPQNQQSQDILGLPTIKEDHQQQLSIISSIQNSSLRRSSKQTYGSFSIENPQQEI